MIVSYTIELKDKKRKTMFGKRIRGIVKENFDWDNIIKKYVEIYDSIR